MLISISAPQNALYYNHVRDPPGLRAFLASSTHLSHAILSSACSMRLFFTIWRDEFWVLILAPSFSVSLDPSLCGLSHSVSLDSYTLKRGGVAVEAVSSATVEVATLYVSLFLFRSTPNLLSLYANFLVSVNVSFSRTLCAHCLRRTLVLTVSGERLKIRTNVSDILTLHLLSVLENKTERARHHKLFTSFGGQARKESAVLFYEVLGCQRGRAGRGVLPHSPSLIPAVGARSWRGAAPSWHNGGGWWQVLLQMEAPPCDGGVLRWERGRESRRGIVDATAHPGIWTE
ncbi:hypothetical protein D0Y65_048768 [Glycine soja]|uniref:Uncharacterized protein n=1 Tax=Glycine soja TaxID=3848 RepID=A0A445FU43_GLYSO|nr:hypothetical protein D0Y65_048768 [Glycine soja]RZB52430.1 hypothetical protein D0Y65_048768 [Glycine soja]